MKKIERLLKYVNGREVRKFKPGGMFDSPAYLRWRENNSNLSETQAQMEFSRIMSNPIDDTEEQDNFNKDQVFGQLNGFNSLEEKLDQSLEITEQNPVSEEERAATELRAQNIKQSKPEKTRRGLSDNAKAALSTIGGDTAIAAINAVDGAIMGDKNFSALSLAIDTAVHGVSGALMKSGNPYAMAAGVALEGLNFATKAGGKNVQGYDVGIENSGYGTLGHQDSEAGRIWDNMSNKLAKRNEQARMALAAMDISEDTKYEQEARLNSVTNVLQLNQIALAGGIDTSLLGN